MGRLGDSLRQLRDGEIGSWAAPIAAGAALAAYGAPIGGGLYGAASMAGEGTDAPNIAAGAGLTAAAAGAAAPIGAGAGVVAGGTIARKLEKSIPTGMKFGGFAGTVLAASVSAGLVGRGLSSTVHAPRHVNKMQTAMSQRRDGSIRGMDI